MADEPETTDVTYTYSPEERAQDMRMSCVRAAIDINAASQSLTGGRDANSVIDDAARIFSFVTTGGGQ